VLVNQVINKTIHREMESENTGFGKKKKTPKIKIRTVTHRREGLRGKKI